MKEILAVILMYWGFIWFIIGLFYFTNKSTANRVIRKTLRKIFSIGIGFSLILLASFLFKSMIMPMEIFALSIISSCWLVDLLNRARYRLDPCYNNLKFAFHDIVYGVFMLGMIGVYLFYIFTHNVTFVSVLIKIVLLIIAVPLSSFVSETNMKKIV